MSVDELLDRARTTGDVPSKTAVRKALGVRWDRAVEVHDRLSREAEAAAAERTVELPPPAPEQPETVLPEPVRRMPSSWPLLLIMLPAFVVIWSGWVDMGRLTGFGVVHPLPGIWDEARLNTAITLPIGLEAYAAYALRVWASRAVPDRARRWAFWSAMGSLAVGATGQVAYHLMIAAGMGRAPWQITTAVSCLPVAVLGLGVALRHLVHAEE